MKNHKIGKDSVDNKGRGKIRAVLDSLEFLKNVDVCLTKFKSNPTLLNKISHRFLLTTKLYIG